MDTMMESVSRRECHLRVCGVQGTLAGVGELSKTTMTYYCLHLPLHYLEERDQS